MTIERLAAPELWRRVQDHPLFRDFSDEQREALLHAYEGEETGLRLRRLPAGHVISRKGEYDLALYCVLGGSVDLIDPPTTSAEAVENVSSGHFFGELGAIGGLPRTRDVVAREDAELLEVSRYALKYLEINAHARAMLSERYRDRAMRRMAAASDLFRDLPPQAIDELAARCEVLRYDLRGIKLMAQGEPSEGLYLVHDGFVQVVREEEDGGKRVVAYLRSGDYFGEMALFEGVHWASVLTSGKCELLKVERDLIRDLCAHYPRVEQQMHALIEHRRRQSETITEEISELLERSGQLGVIQAEALLVMDLDLCTKCDNCVKACESLHGKSRLIRNGITLGKYLIPSACRHCDDPKCMNSCPTGAIKRRPQGEIYFEYEKCIGCGNCAIACPFDNIAMVDTPTFDRAQTRKARIMKDPTFFRPYPVAGHDIGDHSLWRRMFSAITGKRRSPVVMPAGGEPHHIPASFPIKCDLCDGLPFMGCVHNCPTGAAMRIDPAELFQGTGAVRKGARVRKAFGGND